MPTTEVSQHKFSAEIESIGKPFNGGDGWDILLNWKLPGSRYNQHINGQNWEDIGGYFVGQTHNWVLNRGSLKSGKTGSYASDYFWDWDQPKSSAPPAVPPAVPPNHQDSGWDQMVNPRAQEHYPENPDVSIKIKVEGVVQGHLEKLAVDLYIAEGVDTFRNDGLPDYLRIREIRDGFFHHVTEHSIMPQHWCYTHDVAMNKGNTGYGHRATHDQLERHEGHALSDGVTGWCIEGKSVVLDPAPDTETQEAPNG